MDFTGNVAVVTGASKGIGRSTSLLLAAGGAHVILVARTTSNLEEVQRAIASRGGSASVRATDLGDPAAIDALARHVADEHGAADIIVNAAGAWHDADRLFKGPPLDETPLAEIDHLFQVELHAAIRVTRALLPAMKSRKRGKVVNLGCGFAGPHEGVGWVHYYVAKKAVAALTEALAAELRPSNIQINSVDPWFVRSEAVLHFFPDESQTALEPQDVARLVVYLASSEAMHISGQNIEIRCCLDI